VLKEIILTYFVHQINRPTAAGDSILKKMMDSSFFYLQSHIYSTRLLSIFNGATIEDSKLRALPPVENGPEQLLFFVTMVASGSIA